MASYIYVGLYYSKGRHILGPGDRDAAVAAAVPVASQVLLSSGTSQLTAIAPTAAQLLELGVQTEDQKPERLFWIVRNGGTFNGSGEQVGTPVHVLADGTDEPEATAVPTADPTLAGGMTDVLHPRDPEWVRHCTEFGEKLAFIDADLEP